MPDPEDLTPLVVRAYLAGQAVPLPEDEHNAAVRRALFVFAAGGDVHREPMLDDPAVLELARDLETPDRRSALQEALTLLEGGEQPATDPDLAWRAYACALLAEAIGED